MMNFCVASVGFVCVDLVWGGVYVCGACVYGDCVYGDCVDVGFVGGVCVGGACVGGVKKGVESILNFCFFNLLSLSFVIPVNKMNLRSLPPMGNPDIICKSKGFFNLSLSFVIPVNKMNLKYLPLLNHIPYKSKELYRLHQ